MRAATRPRRSTRSRVRRRARRSIRSRSTPVDEVTVTVLVDNTFDGLLIGDERVRRPSFAVGSAPAPQFVGGTTLTGLVAEHGFGALVTVRRGERTTSVLFDAGMSPDALVTNADRLQVDLTAVQGIVLSHGHFDHAGGLAGIARRLGPIPDADRGASVRVDPPPVGPAGCRAHGAADARSARAGRRGFHPRRAEAAVAARRRVRPDHRRGRPRDRLRTRHAARASGVDRRGLAARSRW